MRSNRAGRRQLLMAGVAMAANTGVLRGAAAQSFPSRPITMLLPLAVGSAGDVALRLVGQNMAESMKQPVVIEKLDDRAAPEQRTRCAVGPAAHHAPLVGAHLEPRALRACKREVWHELEIDRSPRDLPVELDDEGVVVAAQHLMRQRGWQSDDNHMAIKWIPDNIF